MRVGDVGKVSKDEYMLFFSLFHFYFMQHFETDRNIVKTNKGVLLLISCEGQTFYGFNLIKNQTVFTCSTFDTAQLC